MALAARSFESLVIILRGISVRIFLLTLLVLLPPLAMADKMRSVTVQSSGYVEAIPDTLHLQLTVKQTASSLAIARQAVDDIVPRVLDVAHQLGVDADDIDSSHVSAYPEYKWREGEKHYLGETVAKNIHITLRELDNYGPLLAQLSKLPLARIYDPSLSHSNMEELRLGALKDALAKGRRKALIIAQELAVELGQVLAVQDANPTRPTPRLQYAKAATPNRSDEGGFSYAKQRITASVQIQFELE